MASDGPSRNVPPRRESPPTAKPAAFDDAAASLARAFSDAIDAANQALADVQRILARPLAR